SSDLLRIIEERRRHIRAFGTHAAEQKSCQTVAPFLGKERPRHTQAILWLQPLRFAGIVDRRIRQLMLKEAAMVVPFLLFFFWMELQRIASVLGILCQHRKVESFERCRAFHRQLFADALLFLEALDLVTSGAAVLL